MSHCLDLLCEGLSGIPEIDVFVDLIKFMVKFVKGHKYFLAVFKAAVNSECNAMPVLYPGTRFAYVALMLNRFI